MTQTERKMLRELAGKISELSRGISESAEAGKALKLLAKIRHDLAMYVATEDLTLPLFPEQNKED